MIIFTLILALAFAVVAVIFALANPMIVQVNFFGMQQEPGGSLAIFILIAVALGILIGVLVMTPGAIKRNLALSGEKRKRKGTEKELDKHKSKVTELEDKEKAVAEAKQNLDKLV